jgi:hypothetical protein
VARQLTVLALVLFAMLCVVGGFAPEFAHRSGTYVRSLLGGSRVGA